MKTESRSVSTRPSPASKTLLAAALLLQAGCSLFGIRTSEEANYGLLESSGRFELREYAPQVLVVTRVDATFEEAGDIAFRRLFGYISGENDASREIAMTAPVVADASDEGEEIAMTAPVTGQKTSEGWLYAFVLPSDYTLATAPTPTSDAVELVLEPRKTVAAIRYSGSWDEAEFRRNAAFLRDWIDARNLRPLSSPRAAGYDPPWTLPFLRRNEVLIDVAS